MEKRLSILLDNGVIDKDVYKFSLNTYTDLMEKKKFTSQSMDVFITHLAMATQRVKNGEQINAMDESILNEVKTMPEFGEIKKLTNSIINNAKIDLPNEEKEFIWLHLGNVIKNNKEG